MQVLKSIQRPSLWSIAFATTACLAAAMQASADHVIGTRNVTVNYRDLNLSTIEGATALYSRLKGAARSVCDQPNTALDDHRVWQACYKAAMADAVAKVNSPLLTALNNGTKPSATATALLIK